MLKQKEDNMLHEVYKYLLAPNDANQQNVSRLFRKYLNKLAINSEGIMIFKLMGEEKIVAPRICRDDIIEMCHGSFLSGHQGVCKTHQRILSRFWWPNLHNDVRG